LVKEAPRGASPSPGGGGSAAEPPGWGEISADTSSPPPGSLRDPTSPLEGEVEVEDFDDEEFPAWPDLVLIDGGRGQLEAARSALAEIGVTDVPLVGVAKGADRDAGRETFVVAGRAPFKLAPRDPALYFVQRLRDEAHRFAIGTHRAKRKRSFT